MQKYLIHVTELILGLYGRRTFSIMNYIAIVTLHPIIHLQVIGNYNPVQFEELIDEIICAESCQVWSKSIYYHEVTKMQYP